MAEPQKHRWRPVNPVLDRGVFGHDRQWEHNVVEAIRLGRRAPAAFSLGGADPWLGDGRLNTGATFFTTEGASARAQAEEKAARALTNAAIEANRAKVAKAKAKALAERQAMDAAMEAERQAAADRAKARAEQDAEWERADAERRERQRRIAKIVAEQLREKEQPHFDQLQADAKRRLKERELIFKNKWQCIACKSLKITCELEGAGYNLACQSCGAKAWGKHATLARMAMLAA